MIVLTRPQLGTELRKIYDSVRRRLWVCSPYIGDWRVRCILGKKWWDRAGIDVRLLFDPDEQRANRDTLLRFFERGRIKWLRGLHAKMYVVDDRVLLTSANLTFAGFARGHEFGVVLNGAAARSATSLFKQWWDSGSAFSLDSVLNLPRTYAGTTEDHNTPDFTDPSGFQTIPEILEEKNSKQHSETTQSSFAAMTSCKCL